MQSAIEYAAIPTINLTPLFLVTNPPTNSSQSDTIQVKSTSPVKYTSTLFLRLSTTYFYHLTSKRKVYTVHKSANVVYLQNNVVYSFSLSRLLCAQRILSFYEKTAVTLPPNYLGIGIWTDDFLCQKKFFR